MSFYGNITDMSNLHFQFDAMFNNRTEMEQLAALGQDNIFAGRFVLVKYDLEGSSIKNNIITGFKNQSSAPSDYDYLVFYSDKFCTNPYIFTTFSRPSGQITQANWDKYYIYDAHTDSYYKLPEERFFSSADASKYYVPNTTSTDNIVGRNTILQVKDSTTGDLTSVFYKCSAESQNGEPAKWDVIILDAAYDNYFINYNIDFSNYLGTFDTRGYDATVWQKVYDEGQGSFVLICRLNTTAPAFELFPEKPSFSPSAPYIDSKSTDLFYRIHTPSMWGFEFREDAPVSEGGMSEQQVSFERTIWDSKGIPIGTEPVTINADIYTNSTGARNIQERVLDEDHLDLIQLEPTGQSGRTYYNFLGEEESPNDTLQLSIHLPSLGNMAVRGYDTIYGYKTIPIKDDSDHIIGYRYPRTTDLDWISGEQPDEIKENGYNDLKTHDIKTIAGVINTMHDRLGQIIVPLDRWLNPNSANYDAWIASLNGDQYIYSYQTTPTSPMQYYRLGEEQSYITPASGTFKYVAIDFSGNAAAYSPNSFYYLTYSGPSTLEESNSSHQTDIANLQIDGGGAPSSGRYYYKKSIADIKYTPITLELYAPHKYFLKDGTSYIRDNGLDTGNEDENSPTNPYGQYYYINETNLGAANANVKRYNFYMQYEPNQYYYRDPDSTNYLLSTSSSPNGTIQYNTRAERQIEATPIIIYQPNVFYYSVGVNSGQFIPITEDTYEEFLNAHEVITNDPTFQICWLEFEETPIITGVLEDGVYKTFLSYPVKENGVHPITDPIEDYPTDLVNSAYNTLANTPGVGEINRTLYCKDANDNYIALENTKDLVSNSGVPYYATPRQYYAVVLVPQNLYVKGRYYIRTPDDNTGDYVISWGDLDTSTLTNYYTIDTITPVTYSFYAPDTYWYLYASPDDYQKDQTPAYKAGHTYPQQYSVGQRKFGKYFTKQRLYVESDSSGRCPIGFEWNEDSVYIPASVTLKTLKTQLVLKEIEGINNGASSINGAILHLQKEYDAENKTRDISTFRGGLNKLQDLLYTIDKLTPGRVVYVNDFGQLTTGDLTYAQLAALVH